MSVVRVCNHNHNTCMTMEKTTKYHCTADAFHCDFLHQECVGHLGNAMLNAADMHSTQRNFGMTYLNTINKTWVLSRLVIELEDIPVEHDKFVIETWVENAMKYFTRRNWAITSEDGAKVYGYGKSIWAMIDLATREPQDIFAVHGGRIAEVILQDKECPIDDVSRVKTPEMSEYTEFPVMYSDIDVNGHCNSMRYIDHVMDTYTLEFYRENQLKRMEIAYVAECYCGDTVRIYKKSDGENGYFFRLVKLDADAEVELCRLKLTFRKK